MFVCNFTGITTVLNQKKKNGNSLFVVESITNRNKFKKNFILKISKHHHYYHLKSYLRAVKYSFFLDFKYFLFVCLFVLFFRNYNHKTKHPHTYIHTLPRLCM